jgi:phospholipase D
MSYAFTLKELAGELLRKKEAGVRVEGVMENTGKYSVYELLNEINVKKHGRGLMHHKVFIIDNRTVITGSFNPTKNGNERNDENMIIVHNAEVAEKYLNEFSRLTG